MNSIIEDKIEQLNDGAERDIYLIMKKYGYTIMDIDKLIHKIKNDIQFEVFKVI